MLRRHLTLTDDALRNLVRRLSLAPDRAVLCPAGVSRLPGRLEWLVHTVHGHTGTVTGTEPQVLACAADEVRQLPRQLRRVLAEQPADATPVVLALGVGPAAGALLAGRRTAWGLESLDQVAVVGAGLPRLVTAPPEEPEAVQPPPDAPAAREIWSRTIGALGEASWQRLCDLHVGVLGCGRSGALAVSALAQVGIRQLTLIDPDHLEAHNLGEMAGVSRADLGRPKVHAVAETLRSRSPVPATSLHPVPASALCLTALVAAKQTDVLVCCVDNAPARFAAAFLAAVYLKPLLDIGTGILRGADPERPSPSRSGNSRRMGADIRLVLPGRCLLCLGGVADLERGRADWLASLDQAAPPLVPVQPDWRRQRAGSLASLNGVAVHLGLRLLEDLVSGRLGQSTWLHLEFTDAGIPTLEHRQPPARPLCRLCALTGLGDAGVRELRTVLEGV